MLLNLARREIGALIFFHRNFVQNERFKKEVDALRNKLNHLEEIRLENSRLTELLAFKKKSHYRLTAARVIANSPDNWSKLLIIDKGESSGIAKDSAVMTHLGLVGKVVETTHATSKIMLINDPHLSVSAIVERSRQEGLVCGTLGSNLVMRYLGEEPDIKLGDTVVTSGLNQAIPKGLAIGSVIEIGKEFSGLSYYALIKPGVSLSNVEEVLIVSQ